MCMVVPHSGSGPFLGYVVYDCFARISSTRLTFPSLPPEVMDLSVRVPMRMSVWVVSSVLAVDSRQS
jgi:hypothetical protein